MRLLVVVDMQNDFITGALGTPEAKQIVPKVKDKILTYRKNGDMIIFTRDEHHKNYLDTQEGHLLPVRHCIKDTHGWKFCDELDTSTDTVISKEGFAANFMVPPNVDSIELIGLCTDICLISNALRLKALYTETPIYVDAECCAGTSIGKHMAALDVMESCQIHVTNRNNKGTDTFDRILEMIKEGRSAEEIESVIGDFGITYMEHGIKFPWQK